MTRPYRILIADDEKPVAVGLQNQLESLGYDVVAVVSDGHRAIEMCRRRFQTWCSWISRCQVWTVYPLPDK